MVKSDWQVSSTDMPGSVMSYPVGSRRLPATETCRGRQGGRQWGGQWESRIENSRLPSEMEAMIVQLQKRV